MFNLYVSVVVDSQIGSRILFLVLSTQVCTVNKQVIEMDLMLSRMVKPLSVYLNWSEIDPQIQIA